MERWTQQEAARENAQPERRAERPATRDKASAGAARAAAVILNKGQFLHILRPEDMLALGTKIGNSALSALLPSNRPGLAPFHYVPLLAEPEPFAVSTHAPQLCGQTVTAGDTYTEPFPASSLRGGDSPFLTGGTDESAL